MTSTKSVELTTGLLQAAMDVVLDSENSQDLCRKIVHSELFAELARGAFIYLLNNRSNLVEYAGYGEPFADGLEEISAWDENPASMCVRTKAVTFQNGDPSAKFNTTLAIPLMHNNAPIGCVVVVLSPECSENPFPASSAEPIQKLLGFFVATKGSKGSSSKISDGAVEDLTTRQVTILGYMSDGLTNAEISTKVLLSESTVRQESIRIYRALQVSGRQEAVAKARMLGLIPSVKFAASR